MLILVTNDDGVHAEGLTELVRTLQSDHEVVVCAPERERTAVAHAITLHKPLRIKNVGPQVFATNGTPVDSVILGVKAILKRNPEFIISGINRGANMGRDICYSGTVAAAKEGAFLGVPSMAVSMEDGENVLFREGAKVVRQLIQLFSAVALPSTAFLNVNIPNLPASKIKGFLVTKLGSRPHDEEVEERVDPRGNRYYWISSPKKQFEPADESDFHAVSRGYVSITPLLLQDDYVSLRQYVKNLLGGCLYEDYTLRH
jgi:5'-nucleotidase